MTAVTTETTVTTRRAAPDATLAGAVDLARRAAEELAAAGHVGEHLGAHADGERLVTHDFACLDPAYLGWRWAVTVTRASRSKTVTVDEAVLLPGDGALLAPAWVPWNERLKPGDLGVGDLLVTEDDDDRLEPGYTATVAPSGDLPAELDDEDRVAIWELGLGRPRVLSPIGRDDAADRWYSGDHGPEAPIALAAPAPCASCGFYLPIAGSLRQLFGVCANEYSPDDGKVVSADHGCGAHSEVAVLPGPIEVTPPVVDDVGYDVIALHPVAHPPGSVDDSAPAEDLGHS
ncbi:MAG: DUF3027 domain-containing protein [Actinomycetes bacterium]